MYTKDGSKSIGSIPPVGSIIYTKHDGRFDCVASVIKIVHADSIEIEFVDDYFSRIIFIDDILVCKASDKNSSYILQCAVKDIKVSQRSIVLDIMSSKTVSNLRSLRRYDVSFIATVLLGDDSEHYSIVMNLSSRGLNIIIKHTLPQNEKFNLKLFLPGTSIVELVCLVQWSNTVGDNNLYGLTISEISKKDESIYDGFLAILNENENKLVSKSRYFKK